MKKVCEICGREFEPNRRQQFCSVECAKKAKVVRNRKYKQAKRQERKLICLTCGEEFKPTASRQKYCSPECYRVAKNLQAKQYPPKQRICVICGAKFETQNYETKTCSPECSFIFRQERTKLALKNIGKDKVIEVPNEELKVRVMSFTEDYHFNTLRQSVNFLSLYTEFNTMECIELLRERKDKIGEYKIFYD